MLRFVLYLDKPHNLRTKGGEVWFKSNVFCTSS